MNNWKIPLGFAGFGAFVSLLAGIIGGNPFGVILLRLVLSAVVCSGLGLAFNFVVKKFLPELSSNAPVPEMDSGEEVDIVIDEDIPLAQEAAEGQTPGSEELPESVELTEPVELPAESASDQEFQMDVAEDVEASEVDVLPLEGAETEEQPVAAEPIPAAAPETDFEDLDTLPDIDQFSPTTEESVSPSKPSRANSQVEEVVRDQDPENLARAVRTFMKKDQ
jgi:hypothetical protein